MHESKTTFGLFIHWGLYSQLAGEWKDKAPYDVSLNCLVSTRIGSGLGDFAAAGDNEIPGQTRLHCWETPGTMNNTWGYSKFDNDWKSAEELIFWLVDIASKGGNYRLNVGPPSEGIIPEQSLARLAEIGRWSKVNGESIYGTRLKLTA